MLQVLASASGSFDLSGSQICIWDLQQLVCKKVLSHHEFDIVCLVLQVLASASGSFGLSGSQICIWDLQQLVCKKVLSHHEFDIVCLAYSRDDKFLVSVGEYTRRN